MLKFLFARKYNLFDVFYLSACGTLLAQHQWLSAALGFVVGLVTTITGEIMLAQRDKALS